MDTESGATTAKTELAVMIRHAFLSGYQDAKAVPPDAPIRGTTLYTRYKNATGHPSNNPHSELLDKVLAHAFISGVVAQREAPTDRHHSAMPLWDSYEPYRPDYDQLLAAIDSDSSEGTDPEYPTGEETMPMACSF